MRNANSQQQSYMMNERDRQILSQRRQNTKQTEYNKLSPVCNHRSFNTQNSRMAAYNTSNQQAVRLDDRPAAMGAFSGNQSANKLKKPAVSDYNADLKSFRSNKEKLVSNKQTVFKVMSENQKTTENSEHDPAESRDLFDSVVSRQQ